MRHDELGVIGDLLLDDLETEKIVLAVHSNGLIDEHFAEADCRAAFVAVMRTEHQGENAAENRRSVLTVSGATFAETAIAAADPMTVSALQRIAAVAKAGRTRIVADATMKVLQQRERFSEDFLRSELHRVADLGRGRSNNASLHLVSLCDFLAVAPCPIDPIVEGCFESGDKVELIAPSKCRKSFFAIDLALHIAAGKDFLSLKVPKPRRVLYINLEIKADWMKRRLTKRLKGYGLDQSAIGDNLMLLNCRSRGEMVRDGLLRFLSDARPEFVVIDPRYKLMRPDENENAGEGLIGILTLLDAIAETGAAVMVVAHDTKGDSASKDIRDRGAGSSWAVRDTDCRFTLTPGKENPNDDVILAVLARNYPPHQATLLHSEPECFVWDETADLSPSGKIAPAKDPSLDEVTDLLRRCAIPMLRETFVIHVSNTFRIGVNRARAIVNEALVQNRFVEGRKTRPGAKKMLGFPEWFVPRQASLEVRP